MWLLIIYILNFFLYRRNTSMSSAQPYIIIDEIEDETPKKSVGAFNPQRHFGDSGSAAFDDGGYHRDKDDKTKLLVVDLSGDGDDEECNPTSKKQNKQPVKPEKRLQKRRERDQEENDESHAGAHAVAAENMPRQSSLRSAAISTVPLLPNSAEYKEVHSFFLATGRGLVIHSISRIVNRRREEQFQHRRAALLASAVETRTLRLFFGGKSSDLITAILTRGFTIAGLEAQANFMASFSESAVSVDMFPAPHQRMLLFDVLAISRAQEDGPADADPAAGGAAGGAGDGAPAGAPAGGMAEGLLCRMNSNFNNTFVLLHDDQALSLFACLSV